jgi:hypothetical protein
LYFSRVDITEVLQLGNSPHNIAIMTVYAPFIAEYVIIPSGKNPKCRSSGDSYIALFRHSSTM